MSVPKGEFDECHESRVDENGELFSKLEGLRVNTV